MSPEQRAAIASKGGKAAHAKGKAHRYTSEEARAAGEIGGAAVVVKYGPQHMAELGRKGGTQRGISLVRRREEVAQ